MLKDQFGYRYHFVKSSNEKTWWYCVQRKTQEACLSYAIVKNDIIIQRRNHNHSNSARIVEAKSLEVNHVKRAAESSDLPPRSVLKDIANEMNSKELTNFMTKKETITRKIRREKARSLQRPPLPKRYEEYFNIPDKYSQTSDGKQFLQSVRWTDGDDSKVLLLFMSDHGKQILKTYNTWQMDGTFSACPEMFYQVFFVFVTTDSGKTIPAAYSLLPDKQCYEVLFEEIKKALNNSNGPDKVMVDYEKGLHNKFSSVFSDTEISGCLFHFKQCIRRNLSDKGCLKLYNSDAHFQEFVSMLYSLPFVPETGVVDTFVDVIKPFYDDHYNEWAAAGYDEEITSFYTYFERTFIGFKTRKSRKAPLFEIALWNHYNSIIKNDFLLTNNGCEAYHSSWNPTIPKNASVWTVIESFIKEDSLAKVTHNEVLRGEHQAHNSSRVNNLKAKQKQLHSICENASKYTARNYMEAIQKFYKM